MRSLVAVAAVGLAVAAMPAAAQNRPVIGVGLAASSMGIAVDGAAQVTPRIGVRGRFAWMPYEPTFTVDGIEYDMELPTPQMGLFVDLTLVGPLRVTGGLRYSANDLSATGVIPGTVQIGDSTYTGAQIGNFSGSIVTKKAAPYLGIGFGRVAGRGLGLFVDAGVAFHGTPVVDFQASGPIASQASFQTELAREVASANADIEKYKYYPVIAIGLRYGF